MSLTNASKALHKTDHGDPCPYEAEGRCALVNDGPWGKAALPAIEAEANDQLAQQLREAEAALRQLADWGDNGEWECRDCGSLTEVHRDGCHVAAARAALATHALDEKVKP